MVKYEGFGNEGIASLNYAFGEHLQWFYITEKSSGDRTFSNSNSADDILLTLQSYIYFHELWKWGNVCQNIAI